MNSSSQFCMNAVYVTCRWSHHDLRLYDKSYEGGGAGQTTAGVGAQGKKWTLYFYML